MQDPEVDIDEFTPTPNQLCPACQCSLDDDDDEAPEVLDDDDQEVVPRDPTCLVCGGE